MRSAWPGAAGARARLALVLLGLASFLCASCGKKARRPTVPVAGKVYWKKTGTPATGAQVVFHPLTDADPASWRDGYPFGTVEADGSFRLTTYEEGDGAPTGEYAVLITWPRRSADNDTGGDGEEGDEDTLEGAYNAPDKPRWKVRVEEQGTAPTDLTFILR